jgi:ribulose-phosphate 3-epimerase
MQDIEIVPSLLSADFARLEKEIKKVERAGCGRLHLDIMDGHFVPNITIGPVVINAIRKRTRVYLQVHLMIEQPHRYTEVFQRAGADCIIIHQEVDGDSMRTIRKIKRLGLDAGIALRPKTPVETLKDIVGQTDIVLIMTVEPGFGGQFFIKGMEKKIVQAKALLEKRHLDIPIGVDGGINIHTASVAAKAGASHLIAGSAVFRGRATENIHRLKKAACAGYTAGGSRGIV